KTTASGTTTYSYTSNRLSLSTGAEADTYAYDANANVTGIRGFTLAYDVANRLTSVNGGVVTYAYDGDGRRIKKFNTATGRTTLYHHDRAGNILAETDATGAKEVEYLYINGQLVAKIVTDNVPPTISGVSAFGMTASGATITWTTNEVSDSQVEYGTSTAYGASSPLKASLVPSHNVTLTGLSPTTLYHYQVKSRDPGGNLTYSADFTLSTLADTTPPTPPASLTTTTISATQINLTWIASADDVGVTGYQVERCQGTGCTTFAQIATTTGTSYSDTGLAPSTSYSYQVKAVDATANVRAAARVADMTPPTPPENLTATTSTSGHAITVNWAAAADDGEVKG